MVEEGQRSQLQQRNSQRLQTFNQVSIRRLDARDKPSARGHEGGRGRERRRKRGRGSDALWARIEKTQNEKPCNHPLSHERGSERSERASKRVSAGGGARVKQAV